jgi:hypothetical protein
MRVVVNGIGIIGIERHLAKTIVDSLCDRCLHRTIAHQENGCTIEECPCKKGYTSFQLLQDEDFVSELIKEGLF